MDLRELLSRLKKWLQNRLSGSRDDFASTRVSDDGFIINNHSSPASDAPASDDNTASKTLAVRGKPESIEKIQAGFDRLVDQLQGINDNLARQAAHHETLIARIDQLPKIVEGLPAVVENQKALTEQLVTQIKTNILKDQQLLEAVEKIPSESAKQTDALLNIDRQLAASADVDVQMTHTFNKFNESLDKVNKSTRDHTEGIAQMSRTFAASDRYLKFIVSRQARQFIWVFYSALGICIAVIIILVGIIVYLSR
jgi:DNA repair exonuclease SbcCD ATPase subunit